MAERIVRDYYQRGRAEVLNTPEKKILLAAAYCRVSTKQDQQQDSYSRQVSHYTEFIKSRPEEYELVEIFADKGTSGLAMRRRKEFNRMVAMALDGKINIIFVKSISRYGRNVVDILSTTRALREKGVTIVFEKENINSLDPKCDMMLSILSTLSEDESRSISTNVRWSKERLFEKGIVRINFSAIYGYRGGGKGEVTICDEEAEEIRNMYVKFISGWSYADLAKDLTRRGKPTVRGKADWDKSTIKRMLEQEKYLGDVLLKKTFKADFMQLYPVKNEGQVAQKYIENNHPAIVTREMFAAVQAEIERRNNIRSSGKTGRGRYSGKYAFSNLIVCGECGYRFRRHTFKHNCKSRGRIDHPVWTCTNHITNGKDSCSLKPIREDRLIELFTVALNDLLKDRHALLAEIEEIIIESVNENGAFDGRRGLDIDAEIERLQAEVMSLTQKRIKREITSDELKEKTDVLTEQLDDLFDERDDFMASSGAAALEKAKLEAIKLFLQTEHELSDFDKDLPQRLLETVSIRSRDDIVFEFKNGLQAKARTEAASVEVIVPKSLEEITVTQRAKAKK